MHCSMCSDSSSRYCEWSRLSSSSPIACSARAALAASWVRWPRWIAFSSRSWKSIVCCLSNARSGKSFERSSRHRRVNREPRWFGRAGRRPPAVADQFSDCGALVPPSAGSSGFNSKNCFKSPKVRKGALPAFISLVNGTSGFGLGLCSLRVLNLGLRRTRALVAGASGAARAGGRCCGRRCCGCRWAARRAAIAAARRPAVPSATAVARRLPRRRPEPEPLPCPACRRPCAFRRARRLRALGARGNHRQRHAAPRLVDLVHPDLDDVADRHHFVRIADILVGQLADVHQARVVQADVDERAEIDHVQHRARQLHAGRQVVELDDALLEDRRRQVFARVAARPGQLRQNVLEQQRAGVRAARPARRVRSCAAPLGNLRRRSPSRPDRPRVQSSLLQHLLGQRRSFPDESRWRPADCRRRRSSESRPPARTPPRRSRALP